MRDRLFRFVFSMVRNRDTADDICQETLYKLLTYRDEINSVHGFALTVAKSQIVQYYRNRWLYERLEDVVDTREDVLGVDNAVDSAVSCLKKEYYDVIRLYYFDKISTRDIGARLGISRSNVKVRLYRARRNLRANLELSELVNDV